MRLYFGEPGGFVINCRNEQYAEKTELLNSPRRLKRNSSHEVA